MTSEFIPGLVAVIGRPNVGKSTLFNRLVKERVSIVQDIPGVTRDRIYRETEHWGIPFVLCDTGGFEPKTDDPILQAMRRQTQLAIEQADAVIFLTDGISGLTGADQDVAHLLRRAEVPVFLAVNKCEAPARQQEAWEFTQLGLGDLHIISAEQGVGISDLLDDVIAGLPKPDAVEEDEVELVVDEVIADAPLLM